MCVHKNCIFDVIVNKLFCSAVFSANIIADRFSNDQLASLEKLALANTACHWNIGLFADDAPLYVYVDIPLI